MAINNKNFFEKSGKNLDLVDFSTRVLSAGQYFSGSIYYDNSKTNYCLFYSVNKEKMQYILEELDTTKEVKLEIYAHASNSEEIQPKDYWPEFKC